MLGTKDLITSPAYYSSHWSCGYCNLKEKQRTPQLVASSSVGIHLYKCSPEKYESLVNRGYRRSGEYLYRHDLLRNCCQLYTIRTSYHQTSNNTFFNPSKDQKRCINKFANFLKIDLKNPKNKFRFEESILNLQRSDPKVFRTVIEPAQFSEKKFELYKKYQCKVHKDKPSEVTQKSFKRFLCTNPFSEYFSDEELNDLNEWDVIEDSKRIFTAMGAFHECYYINNEMVAISVIDILPNSISSVYFIWDPDYANLGLGNFSALRDMILTYKLNKKHYYLGYYVPTCPKMFYKKKYGGELLDIANHRFVNLKYLEENDLMEEGKPFIMKEVKEDMDVKNINLDHLEPMTFEDESIYPETWKIEEGNKLINISKTLYGPDGSVTKNENKIYSEGKQMFPTLAAPKIDPLPTVYLTKWESENNESENEEEEDTFPKVQFGSIPLWGLNEIIRKRKSFSIEDDIVMLQMQFNQLMIVPGDFVASDAEFSSDVLNLLRSIGPNILKDSAVIKP
ncbi:arginyltransferase [Saccharomycopsis crataegensis]|uniref:arginyltransferase n=1 Tax=Saccharomycopsis crataegensis TaxID=43959 RepID=A0AAV5QN71_9ASCO|nr:arginyltransferase [Saccharomycopsis crataegensis]